jgi:tRNA-(ms[2]io[6]A)-hydroxylase
MLSLRSATAPAWLDTVMSDFDTFLVDHAACERKASATGMSFVVKYSDKPLIVEPMIELAREELEHFHIVYRILRQRGVALGPDTKDEYVRELRAQVRTAGKEVLLDRLLVAGVVEARGCERFGLVAEALTDETLQTTYRDLTRSESRHHGLFFRLARQHFAEERVVARAGELLDFEAELVARLPLRSAVH